jgi:uncharacterized protein YndB with AHSA1/START domain
MSKKVKATSKQKTKPAVSKKSAKANVKPSKAPVKKAAPSKTAKKVQPTPKKAATKKIAVATKKAVSAKKLVPAKKVVTAKKAVPTKKVASVKKAVKPASKPITKPTKAVLKVKEHAVKPTPQTESKGVISNRLPASKAEKLQPVQDKPTKAAKEKAGKAVETAESKNGREVLAINNTIPTKAVDAISPSKIASISSSITNPIRRPDSYSVKMEKEPTGKFEMEFVVHASAEMLYEFISTASGLSEWFCDDLNIRNGIYTFIWEDQMQQARLLKTVEYQLVRFQWVDKTDGSYFEFRIQKDDLTNDISLIVTDFADSHGDRESSKLLWNSQIEKLLHVIGSIF